jgi:hypothetical protein
MDASSIEEDINRKAWGKVEVNAVATRNELIFI